MIVITGASGQLGRLVIQELLTSTPANEIVAAVRNPEKVQDLATLGVQIRQADYTQIDTLVSAFAGATKVLLISSSEVGQRVAQHTNVIQAAKQANVGLLAYTSLLHASDSPLGLASEHQVTEKLLADSGVPYVLLRNGWYTENYMASIPTALQFGVHIGCAGEGKISSAVRADYAAAAAKVLTLDDQAGKVYELAGDEAYTLSDFAAVVSQHSGKPVAYQNMPQAEFSKALQGAGLPEGFADLLANSDFGASQGGLFDASKTLSQLIGRPTVTLDQAVAQALANVQ